METASVNASVVPIRAGGSSIVTAHSGSRLPSSPEPIAPPLRTNAASVSGEGSDPEHGHSVGRAFTGGRLPLNMSAGSKVQFGWNETVFRSGADGSASAFDRVRRSPLILKQKPRL